MAGKLNSFVGVRTQVILKDAADSSGSGWHGQRLLTTDLWSSSVLDECVEPQTATSIPAGSPHISGGDGRQQGFRTDEVFSVAPDRFTQHAPGLAEGLLVTTFSGTSWEFDG